MPPEQRPSPEEANHLSRVLQRRLATPVLIAAIVSVPAVLLTVWAEGVWARIGSWANVAAGVILWAEWILLIVFAEDKLKWLRANRWSTFVAAVTLPAVVFTLGPAQLLRLLRVAGTLPVFRMTRIIEAGGVVRRRLGLSGATKTAVFAATVALCALAVGALLLDPESATRRFLADLEGRFEPWQVITAVTALGVSTTVIILLSRNARRRQQSEEQNYP
ncbi:hypothetical protein [Nocardiopsis kunsanensis]|uniref:Ion transporter n=1 Tax=Nocardiopsis kunsanensis TaxID=141693 RepID=A0A918XE59_9ACTN|nr:hypothetical protein [Nocardiopsis kunsanensis]GHD27064.1 hypothetical protein GCM10007147_25790 [Nocardiopsis kunsanensis]